MILNVDEKAKIRTCVVCGGKGSYTLTKVNMRWIKCFTELHTVSSKDVTCICSNCDGYGYTIGVAKAS